MSHTGFHTGTLGLRLSEKAVGTLGSGSLPEEVFHLGQALGLYILTHFLFKLFFS